MSRGEAMNDGATALCGQYRSPPSPLFALRLGPSRFVNHC